MLKSILILLLLMSLTSCISVELQTEMPAGTLPFVTSTLAPTSLAYTLPSRTPLNSTLETTPLGTRPVNCKDRAVLLEDVTIPDNTSLPPGEKFTKTWRFQNSGTCPWTGYTVAFLAGDRMGASVSSPVPQTAAHATVDVSVDLMAPSMDGAYTGYFELHDSAGTMIPIGTEKSFWVKIVIGTVITPTGTLTTGTPTSAALYTPGGPLSCDYLLSKPYHEEIAGLINSTRTKAGLPALTINAQLAAAAQAHSIDMACFGLLSHSGSDGSSPQKRVAAAGYPAFIEEIIYASGYPKNAFDWWMNDQIHRAAILNPNAIEMGIGYAYVSTSLYGGYYTVDFGSR
jgi:hypothetical protein